MAFSESIRKWLWKGADPIMDEFSGHGERMEAELIELKKLVRRQGIQQESLVRDISAKLDALSATESREEDAGRPDSLMELAESFFHLEAALALMELGHETPEALNIVWEKLGIVCDESGLEIVRYSGVPFDSRLHEALDRAPDGESPFVADVTAPGFIYNGRVIRPARVMLSDNHTIPNRSESEDMNGE